MKTCKRCEKSLPLESFHKHSGFKDGRRTTCKDCANAEMRKYYAANRESHLETCRNWQKNNQDKVALYQKRHRRRKSKSDNLYKANHPVRVRAQKKLNYAVFKGEVKREESCQVCGCSDKKTEAHHYDYDKPLQVIWVCTSCHGWIHRKYKLPEAANA